MGIRDATHHGTLPYAAAGLHEDYALWTNRFLASQKHPLKNETHFVTSATGIDRLRLPDSDEERSPRRWKEIIS